MKLWVGEGFQSGSSAWALTKKIKESREANEKILELIDKGESIHYRAIYACPCCREWYEYDSPYILDPIKVTPLGTLREYKLRYIDLNENPVCDKCGSNLYHIYNPLSANNPCPKCGADNMDAKKVGNWD